MGSDFSVFYSVSEWVLIRPASTGSLLDTVARLFLESICAGGVMEGAGSMEESWIPVLVCTFLTLDTAWVLSRSGNLLLSMSCGLRPICGIYIHTYSDDYTDRSQPLTFQRTDSPMTSVVTSDRTIKDMGMVYICDVTAESATSGTSMT
jgi:hypothetical protein